MSKKKLDKVNFPFSEDAADVLQKKKDSKKRLLEVMILNKDPNDKLVMNHNQLTEPSIYTMFNKTDGFGTRYKKSSVKKTIHTEENFNIQSSRMFNTEGSVLHKKSHKNIEKISLTERRHMNLTITKSKIG